MPLAAGTRIGIYEIVAAIGAGGMGEVYRARDAKLNRDVALKVLPASLGQDPDRLARFRREAQVLAALNHPNIAHVHGFEDSGDVHALVMELVEGPTLAERISQGPLPLVEALPIAKQIAEAMEAAHEQGIVHRDLKPANVKVREDGTVKVLDFGLAKAAAVSDDPSSPSNAMNSPTLTARATQLGVILGTAAYMAPEQAKGRTVDRRADIWAFGVVLFEMLTGRRGYDAEDISETLAAVLTREVDWSALPAATPARLKALVRDCLVRDPKQRLRDIGDARRELERMIEGGPDALASAPATQAAAAAPPAPLWRRALPWVIATLAVIVSGVAMSGRLGNPAPPPRLVTRAELQLKEFAALVAVSHDGTKVAFTAAGGASTTYLALRLSDQFVAKPIPGSEGGAWPIFSPDGQWLAYSTVAGSTIKKMPLTGGTSITLGDGSFQAGADWSADDRIVFAGAKGLMEVASGGGTPTALTTVDADKGETRHHHPHFLPGGTQLLFTVDSKDSTTGSQFAVLDLAAKTYRTVARGGANGRYVNSGHLTYMRGPTLFAVPFDLATLSVTGAEVPVVEGVSTVGPSDTADYTVSDAGLLVYVSGSADAQGTTLAWSDRSGKTTVLPGQATRVWGTGRLSPDGRFVANGITDNTGGRDIWIFDVTRGTPTRVSLGGDNDLPVWTPDSRHIFYRGTVEGKSGIYQAPVDGSAKPALVLATDTPATPEAVAPDGESLLFSQAPAGGRTQLMVLDLSAAAGEAKPRPLHDASAVEANGAFSVDGRLLAYISLESGGPEVYVQAASGSGAKQRVSLESGSRPRWSRDGRELLYWSGAPATRLMSVAVPADGSLRFGEPKMLFQNIVGTTWDITPDRDKFLVELTTTSSGAAGTTIATVTDWFEELRRNVPVKK